MTTFTTQDRQDAQREPLTNEQILELALELTEDKKARIIRFARAIEHAHGIGE